MLGQLKKKKKTSLTTERTFELEGVSWGVVKSELIRLKLSALITTDSFQDFSGNRFSVTFVKHLSNKNCSFISSEI